MASEATHQAREASQQAKQANEEARAAAEEAKLAHIAVKRTEEALIVTNAMLDRQGDKLKDHHEWLASSLKAWHRHEKFMAQLDRQLKFIADMLLRDRIGNGHGSEPQS